MYRAVTVPTDQLDERIAEFAAQGYRLREMHPTSYSYFQGMPVHNGGFVEKSEGYAVRSFVCVFIKETV